MHTACTVRNDELTSFETMMFRFWSYTFLLLAGIRKDGTSIWNCCRFFLAQFMPPLATNPLASWFLLKVDIIPIVCELLLHVCFLRSYRIDKIFCIFASLWSNHTTCPHDSSGANCCRPMVGGGYATKRSFHGCSNSRGASKFWNNTQFSAMPTRPDSYCWIQG